MKTCRDCGETKVDGDFYRRSGCEGLRPNCKKCFCLVSVTYHQTTLGRESLRKAVSRYKKTDAGRAKNYESHDRWRKTPIGRLRVNLRGRLRAAIKRGSRGGSAVRDLGCSIEELRSYLERLWGPGMSWDNWGREVGQWQIDHIRPLSSFDLQDQDELRQACHFTNLQPLWWDDHVAKTIEDRKLGL